MIDLDHNATTPLAPEVISAMQQALAEHRANPSSPHSGGRSSRRWVEEARSQVALSLSVSPSEVIFTSGGSEANRLAIEGVVASAGAGVPHVITTAVEHPSVLDVCARLERLGRVRLTHIPVDSDGMWSVASLVSSLAEDTALVSVMHANNETGNVFPVAELSAALRRQPRQVTLHVDAVQTFARLPLQLEALGCDLISVSAHKIYGPKGIGALIVRHGLGFDSPAVGGAQEGARRGGTENVVGIAGFAAACRRVPMLVASQPRIAQLRDRLTAGLLQLPEVEVNGHPVERLANTVNVCLQGVDAEELILSLDEAGVAVSSGSACSSGLDKPSHVLCAMGRDAIAADSSVRFSLGHDCGMEEIERVLALLPELVARAR